MVATRRDARRQVACWQNRSFTAAGWHGDCGRPTPRALGCNRWRMQAKRQKADRRACVPSTDIRPSCRANDPRGAATVAPVPRRFSSGRPGPVSLHRHTGGQQLHAIRDGRTCRDPRPPSAIHSRPSAINIQPSAPHGNPQGRPASSIWRLADCFWLPASGDGGKKKANGRPLPVLSPL